MENNNCVRGTEFEARDSVASVAEKMRIERAVEVLQSRRAGLLGKFRAMGLSLFDAEDVLQETVIGCGEDLQFDPGRADSSGYVTGKAWFLARHQRTRVGRQACREVTADLIETLDAGGPVADAPRLVERAALASALGRLSASDRDLLWQIVVDDTPAVEIARTEGQQAATIRKRFQRALDRARAGWECAVGEGVTT